MFNDMSGDHFSGFQLVENMKKKPETFQEIKQIFFATSCLELLLSRLFLISLIYATTGDFEYLCEKYFI